MDQEALHSSVVTEQPLVADQGVIPLEKPGTPPARPARVGGPPHRKGFGTTGRGYSRTGLNALKARIKVRGLDAIDKRTLAARGLLGWKASLVQDLGGTEDLSTQKMTIIDLASKLKLYGDHLDAYMVEQQSLVNKKLRAVVPIVRERIALGDALLRCLQSLGLKRRQREVQDFDTLLGEASPGDGDGKQAP